MGSQLSRAKKAAKEYADNRNHKLGNWQSTVDTANNSCTRCSATISVDNLGILKKSNDIEKDCPRG